MMLEGADLRVQYGSIEALHGVSFDVKEGEIVTLIGANGAGKTTILKTISGLLKPKSGQLRLRGADISHVPEGRGIIGNLTVWENLLLGAFTRPDKKEVRESAERVFGSFPRLKERRNQLAGTLSGGEQQMLAIGRGMMSRPSLLLLDEPSMGLAPILVDEIFDIVKRINQEGTTILLVEQNAFMALQIAHRAYCLETGRIVLGGSAQDLRTHPRVRSAYLGEIQA